MLSVHTGDTWSSVPAHSKGSPQALTQEESDNLNMACLLLATSSKIAACNQRRVIWGPTELAAGSSGR